MFIIFKKMASLAMKIMNRKSEVVKEHLLNNGLKVGDNFECYSWENIDYNWPWLISIGNNVTISSDVRILAHDASPVKAGLRTKVGRVVIGNNVFIGTRVTILCNTRIGDNVIIGAGSVVSHDLASGNVYAGVPAKRICTMRDYKAKQERLREERPDFSKIKAWNEWGTATEEEKTMMINALSDGCGYI